MTTTEINFTEEELQKYGYLTSHCRSVENANYEFNRVLTSALKNPKSIRDVVRNIKLITNPEIFMVCDIEREDITLLSDYLRKAITPLGLKEFPAIQPQRFADLIKGSAIGKNDLKLNALEEIISWYYLANEGYVKKRDEGIQISYDIKPNTYTLVDCSTADPNDFVYTSGWTKDDAQPASNLIYLVPRKLFIAWAKSCDSPGLKSLAKGSTHNASDRINKYMLKL